MDDDSVILVLLKYFLHDPIGLFNKNQYWFLLALLYILNENYTEMVIKLLNGWCIDDLSASELMAIIGFVMRPEGMVMQRNCFNN